jgi:hypothetical protein
MGAAMSAVYCDDCEDDHGKFSTSHYTALHQGLANERDRLAKAKTPKERELREVWVKQREKELALEGKRIGMEEGPKITISDDDLLAELMGEETAAGRKIGK